MSWEDIHAHIYIYIYIYVCVCVCVCVCLSVCTYIYIYIRRRRRRKKLLDELKDRRDYCHLKEEAVDCTKCRNCFRGGF